MLERMLPSSLGEVRLDQLWIRKVHCNVYSSLDRGEIHIDLILFCFIITECGLKMRQWLGWDGIGGGGGVGGAPTKLSDVNC